MAEPSAPPLQDKSARFSHQEQPHNTAAYSGPLYPEPPPPYNLHDSSMPPGPSSPPTESYTKQPLLHVVPTPPVVAPVQQAAAPSPQPTQVVVVVDQNALPPGTCTVCRKGKMKNSASCWTWLCCCLLLTVGILPGLFVFCCCCRHPKCTHCGYTP